MIMTDKMFIRLPQDPEAPVQWLRPHEAGDATVHSGTLAAAAAVCGDTPVVAFLPTAQLVLLRADIPTHNRTRLMQAMPYALEEQLAEDVEQLHFAHGPSEQHSTPVAVIAKRTLESWLERLQHAGIAVDAVIPDVLALPWQPGQWTVLIEPHGSLVRIGPHQGWAADHDNLALLLETELDRQPPPERVQIFSACGHQHGFQWPGGVEVDQQECVEQALTLLARHHRADQEINLLQGPYQSTDAAASIVRRWRWVAGLGLLLIAVELGAMAVESYRLGQQLNRISQRIEHEFRSAFPEIQRIVDAKVQMQQQLDRLRSTTRHRESSGGFLPLLQTAGPTLVAPPRLHLNSLHYRDDRLDINVNAQSFQALDDLKRTLGDQGLQVEIDSASAQDRGVAGRLRIAGGKS